MAGALDPSTSDWVTADLVPVTGEVPPATWGEASVENGGFNYYQTRMVSIMGTQIHDHGGGLGDSKIFYAYMTAGTYTAYASGSYTDGGASDLGTVFLDGTPILAIVNGASGWNYGSAGVIIASDGWTVAKYSVVNADMSKASIYVRKVSL